MTVESILNSLVLQFDDEKELYRRCYGGMELAILTLAITTILELYSIDTVKLVLKQPNGYQLYCTAIMYNVLNHVVFGVPTYIIAVSFCSSSSSSSITDQELSSLSLSSILKLICEVTYILMAHSIQYYCIHRTFHEYPVLYKTFHRFHHRFNVYVPPSSANAVTVGEYLVAYVIPFAVATLVGRPTVTALRIAICIQNLFNLIVHTPKFEQSISIINDHEDISNNKTMTNTTLTRRRGLLSSFWVTTNDHLNHHRKLQCHYASPTFNIDNILLYFGGLFSREKTGG